MNDLKEFLQRSKIMPEGRMQFYYMWATKYKKDEKNSFTSREIDNFWAHLEKWYGIADKTGQGCDKAISIFSFQEKTGRSAGDGTDEWDDIFQEMVRVPRLKHRSIRTEKSYIVWIRRFRGVLPSKLTESDVRDFLSHLAVKEWGSRATQHQALRPFISISSCLGKGGWGSAGFSKGYFQKKTFCGP